MRTLLPALCLLAGTLHTLHAAAQAIEFRSVKEAAIMYETPSEQGKRLFIVQPGTPVEVVVVSGEWIRVRDSAGAITWMQAGTLSSRRTVMVSADRATVRQQPDSAAPAAFEAVRNTVLEVRGTPANGWVQVAHGDGSTGYLRVTEAWGL
ncbi:MAG: SH3 domain-containing protein [Rhodocyclaceae bacterium]|jgi:SH3-like domain-containing protein|nr:SH3 domain-containing protein [Rhodocyclaceae bacterium]